MNHGHVAGAAVLVLGAALLFARAGGGAREGAATAPADAMERQASSAPATPDTRAGRHAVATERVERIVKTNQEWRKELTPRQYRILREKGTEMAFTGSLLNEKRAGAYRCAGCGLELFASDTKFESGSGWPSFYQPLDPAHVEEHTDRAYGMVRTEVTCRRCGGHLGHVFEDGPQPTGLRYCINSAALSFEPKK